MIIKYNEVLSNFYPQLKFSSIGDGQTYEKLIIAQGGILPSKQELDDKYLQYAKDKAWRRIQVERDRRKGLGVKVGSNWFHSDDTSRIQQLGLVLLGANIPPNLLWKTLGGTFVTMTPTLALQIFGATAASDQAIFAIAEQHKAQALSSENPDLYDHLKTTPIWPKVYGE